jgi:hypothetical protein
MIKYIQIALYFFLVVNGAIFTGWHLKWTYDKMYSQAEEYYLSNGAKWVRFPDGSCDYIRKGDGRQIEMRPSDEG